MNLVSLYLTQSNVAGCVNTARFIYDETAAVQPGRVRLMKSVFVKGRALWNSQCGRESVTVLPSVSAASSHPLNTTHVTACSEVHAG